MVGFLAPKLNLVVKVVVLVDLTKTKKGWITICFALFFLHTFPIQAIRSFVCLVVDYHVHEQSSLFMSPNTIILRFLLSLNGPFFTLLFLLLSDLCGCLLATCEVHLNPAVQDINTRGGIWRHSIMHMSKAHKHVRIQSSVNGRAKQTNTCSVPCKR